MLRIERAIHDDAAEILALQKLAYQSEAAIWNDYTIPPLTQTLENLQAQFADHIILKAVDNDEIIGSVRGTQKNDTCYIGRVIVHPDRQNRGIGTQLMAAIEAAFSTASRFELFTGQKSERNLYLYQKLGYQIFKEEPLNERVIIVYLEKHRA
ncbi:GCN5-related N-acetyltransferase [Candidatus Moduliflexus flocculans]|uniref:GCN5-related N-acetyltransferase n=1 Tax=Candidatus Moduliflexus flocculans TaxID=1499966 RepID=A0A0S6VWD3_9BACT|nr:GCN5-related N-acetyltransferase [Candidatus Moduliflexus flocculans]